MKEDSTTVLLLKLFLAMLAGLVFVALVGTWAANSNSDSAPTAPPCAQSQVDC